MADHGFAGNDVSEVLGQKNPRDTLIRREVFSEPPKIGCVLPKAFLKTDSPGQILNFCLKVHPFEFETGKDFFEKFYHSSLVRCY